MRLDEITGTPVNEVSNELLGRYKRAAALQAGQADKEGDFEKGNKRFSGIIKATKKQFKNDEKGRKSKDVQEDSFDQMTNHLANRPKKSGGRWPDKNKDDQQNDNRGSTATAGNKTVHKSGDNYSGKGYNTSQDFKSRGVYADPKLLLPSVGKQGGSHNLRSFNEDSNKKKSKPVKEADDFKSMIDKIASNKNTLVHPSDVDDEEKQLKRVDTFVDRDKRDSEPWRRPGNSSLIAAGDNIVNFLENYVIDNFGSDEYDQESQLPDAFFYTLRMLLQYDEFIEFITENEISTAGIPRDIERYSKLDLVDWICEQTGVTRDIFERIEDLCYDESDGASTDVIRLFPKNWFYGQFDFTVTGPWKYARKQLESRS